MDSITKSNFLQSYFQIVDDMNTENVLFLSNSKSNAHEEICITFSVNKMSISYPIIQQVAWLRLSSAEFKPLLTSLYSMSDHPLILSLKLKAMHELLGYFVKI